MNKKNNLEEFSKEAAEQLRQGKSHPYNPQIYNIIQINYKTRAFC
ncbi:MAG: hypothetical protein RBS19_01385 [Bacteroidales bacterium]|nr:hypothetical protein [Bacteroidales bacterium]